MTAAVGGGAACGEFAQRQDHGVLPLSPDGDDLFADITRLVADVCRVPMAWLSLIKGDHENIQSTVGWDGSPPESLRFPPFDTAAVSETSLLLVPDVREDARFSALPRVIGSPEMRFYAAVPLVDTNQKIVGVLAVADTSPRLLGDQQVASLRSLARQSVLLLTLRGQIEAMHTEAMARASAEETVRWQAYHDNLTGLPNRALFLERVDDALCAWKEQTNPVGGLPLRRRSSPLKRDKRGVAVLFVDIDRFKRINDTLGHTAGDSLLCEVAARFAGCLRPEETLARYAGDEFTVLLPHTPDGLDYAASVAQMLLQTLSRPVVLGANEYHVSASVGIAFAPHDGEDAPTLIKHADIAMYAAKVQGGYAAYSRTMNADGYQRLIAEVELRHALERGELTLSYQPQIALASGEVVGVEALCRWWHPERGQIPPSQFIQVAEQADLIVPLGEFVLRQACADAAQWRAEGHPHLRVAVNLSARQLSQPGLIETVERALRENKLPGDALDLELTETALCANGDATPQILQQLRAMGIRLFVDDFGTGYSSLAYLRRFPVDVLKIDRAFVAGLGRESTDDAIVRAIIEMAHALHLKVVAEGVETELQRDSLCRLGCGFAQGYLFNRPMSKEDLRTLLTARTAETPRVRRVPGVLTGAASVVQERGARQRLLSEITGAARVKSRSVVGMTPRPPAQA